MSKCSNVVLKARPLTEEQFKATWLLALSRLCKEHGDAQVALWLGVGIEHLRKNLKSGRSLPSPDKVWNLLAYDDTAHDELDADYGVKNCPLHAEAANDIATMTGLCDVAGELGRAISDGKRDHNETLRIADKVRPHMGALSAIVREADEIRGVK